MRKSRACLLWIPVVVSLLACGEAETPPQRISGSPAEVADRVAAFARATALRDFALICEDIYSAAVRQAAGGARCPDLLERATSSVRSPSIDIKQIEIAEQFALVTVIARARDQAPVTETIRLERDRDDVFRIVGLN
ncbi:MAG: hypothetical protein H0U42_04785 [Thermoleophilaceae bacterium]|nr:hypothetical protein [Thermoleophilaceae bacterium]